MSKKMALLTLTTLLAFGFFTGCDDPNPGGDSNSGNQRSPQDKAGGEGQAEGQSEHGAHAAHGAHAEHGTHGAHAEHGTGHGTSSNEYKAVFQFDGAVKAGSEADLTIHITDRGQPVQQFDVNHEKLMHLIIVNDDLSYFEHIHPDYLENGSFTVNTIFPAGGKYKLFADFVPKGASGATLSEWVTIPGEEHPQTPVKPDTNLVQQVDGKRVELSLSNTLSNEEVVLTFEFQDAATKQGIDNLEPYLGAVGHVVILSADAEQYLHVHPVDEGGTGPRAEFATSFPKSGIYKIWGQFQHKNKVITTAFVVEIQ